MPQYTIDDYGLQLEAGPTIGGRRALFFCRSAGTLRGWIAFYDDGASIASPSVDASGRISLTFPMSRYASVMDLLRNEKPVRLYYNSPTFAGLSISGEPVGEQEA